MTGAIVGIAARPHTMMAPTCHDEMQKKARYVAVPGRQVCSQEEHRGGRGF